MTTSVRDLQERSFGATLRRDAWWIAPALTALVLGSFGVYATWAAWVNVNYEWGPYLSPFYSPLIQTSWWPLSPAFLILIFPGAFRATCYYYRKAYYRSFFATPPGCAVGPIPQGRYKGETSLLIFQNLHRYALYFAILFIFILYLHAFKAFFKDGRPGVRGAGLRAAIECSRQGLSTGLVCKSLLGKAHTVMAEGGLAAALGNVDARDNWKIHFRDTMRGGKFLNQWRMAELHAREAPDRVRELEEWGAVFDRTRDGLISQRNFGGHRYPRLAHVGDRTGLEIIRTLQDYAIHKGFGVYMECTALRLLLDGGRIAGVLGYWRESGRFVLFRTRAIVLATGGGGRAWRITSNSWEYSGDGYAMATRRAPI